MSDWEEKQNKKDREDKRLILAGFAMIGRRASDSPEFCHSTSEKLAKACVEDADAILAELEKSGKE
jgi:hypothetical protein